VTQRATFAPNRRFVAFVRARTDQARLFGALKDTGSLVSCQTPAEVLEAVAAGGATAVIVTAYATTQRDGVALAHGLRLRFPTIPVLVYYDAQSTSPHELMEYFEAGASEVIQRDVDDMRRALARVLVVAGHKMAARRIHEYLKPHLPETAAPLLKYILERADTPMSIDQAAAAAGLKRRTLYRRLEKLGYPPPETLIGWCRLLLAAHLLEDDGRTYDDVADSLDFPSGQALRSLLKRYVGVGGKEARTGQGPLALVLQHVTRELTKADDPPATGPH
jgi:AraC-like DNA-binding protein